MRADCISQMSFVSPGSSNGLFPLPCRLTYWKKGPALNWPQGTEASHTFLNTPIIKYSFEVFNFSLPSESWQKDVPSILYLRAPGGSTSPKREGNWNKKKTEIRETEKQSGQGYPHDDSKGRARDHTSWLQGMKAECERDQVWRFWKILLKTMEDSGHLTDGNL